MSLESRIKDALALIAADIKSLRSSSGGAPTGSTFAFAGTAAPSGYLLCDGNSFDPAVYPNLYNVIGTRYGGTASAPLLPDLRRRTAMGADPSTTGYEVAASDGQALTSRTQAHSHTASGSSGSAGGHSHSGTAASAGSHSHSISSDSHSHSLATSSNTTTGGTATRATGGTGSTGSYNHNHGAATGSDGAHTHSVSTDSASSHSHSVSVSVNSNSATGSNSSVPYIMMHHIIKT